MTITKETHSFAEVSIISKVTKVKESNTCSLTLIGLVSDFVKFGYTISIFSWKGTDSKSAVQSSIMPST